MKEFLSHTSRTWSTVAIEPEGVDLGPRTRVSTTSPDWITAPGINHAKSSEAFGWIKIFDSLGSALKKTVAAGE